MKNGMLLIITGLRYTAASSGSSPSTEPVAKYIRGDQFVGTTFTWADYAGYDWEVFAFGINRPLIPEVEFEINEIGTEMTILNGLSLTSEDYFRISTNGTL